MKIENTLPEDHPLRKHLKGKEKINLIAGAYGNMPDCAGIGEGVTRPPEGGIYTKLLGCSYLYKGYPDGAVVEKLETCKDMLWLFLKLLNNWIGRIVLVVLFILPKRFAKKFFLEWSEEYFKIAYMPLARKMLKEREFCTSVRELDRVLNEMISELPEKENWVVRAAHKFRKIIAMGVEYDSAYKFRFQDVFPEFNPEAVKEDPVKEFKRVFEILKRREVAKSMKTKWRGIESKLLLILRISKRARQFMITFFEKVDLERIKMDEADWYFCLRRTNFNYRDVVVEDRLKERIKIDKEKKHQIPRLIIKQEQGGGAPFF